MKWNPNANTESKLPISKDFYLGDVFTSSSGIFFPYSDEASDSSYKKFYGLVNKENQLVSIKSQISGYDVDFILEAPDQSIVVLDVNKRNHNKKLNAEIIRYENGKLSSLFLSIKLPVSLYDSQAIILQDGRLMLIGGSKAEYPALKDISKATFFVDLQTGKWTKGPNMSERRRNMTATLLPNGNVLMVGGDGKIIDNNPAFSTTHISTEIFDVSKNAFISGADMLMPSSEHSAKWIEGFKGKYLMVAGGTSGSVQYFDVENNCWHFIKALGWREAFLQSSNMQNRQPALHFSNFINGRELLLTTQKLQLAKTCNQLPLFQLDVLKEVILNLKNFKFIPAKTSDKPNLIIGGVPFFGDSGSMESLNATKLLWANGRTSYLPKTNNLPSVNLEHLPSPNYSRENNTKSSENLVNTKQLLDGRVVLYGGMVYPQKVALIEESSGDLARQDKYVGIGKPYVANFYEIFDSKTGVWTQSLNAKYPGGRHAIFDNGIVFKISPPKTKWVKLEQAEKTNKHDPELRPIYHASMMEISNERGTAWQTFSYKPNAALDEPIRPFIVQQELFLAGNRVISVDKFGFRKHSYLLEWFDTKNKTWQVLWEKQRTAEYTEKWQTPYDDVLVFRTLRNGKKVVLPVVGFEE